MTTRSATVMAVLARLAEHVGHCSPDQESTVLDAMEQLLDWLDATDAAEALG